MSRARRWRTDRGHEADAARVEDAGTTRARGVSRRAGTGMVALVTLILAGITQVAGTQSSLSHPDASSRLGSLRGRVDIRRVAAAAPPRPAIADFGSRAQPRNDDVPRAVVFLEAHDVPARSPLRAVPRTPTARARMGQRNETLMPHVLA